MSKSIALVALVGALALIPVASAEAALIAYICNDAACTGGGDVQVTDNQAGDANGILGVVSFTTSFGGYELVINSSQSKPFLANGMDLNYTVTNQAGTDAGGAIWLFASDDSFLNAHNSAVGALGGTNPTGVAATTTAYICDGDNNLVNFSPCSTNSFSGTGGFNFNVSGPVTANPYALSIGIGISGVAVGDTATGNFRVNTVPDGGSTAMLLGSMLVAFGAFRRKFNGR